MESEFYITSRKHEALLSLTEEQFRDLKRARKRLSACYAISHKFRLVLSNFEMVKETMATLGQLYIQQQCAEELERTKPRLNAFVNNYVLSARIFTSHLKRHVQGCLPHDRQVVNILTEKMEKEYQRSYAYRFIDSLYDYVSYFGLSIHSMRLNSRLRELANGSLEREYRFKAYIERDFIGGPADFRASVLEETPDRINLMVLLESANVGLQRLHDLALQLTNDVAIDSQHLISEFINVFVGEHGHEHNNLFVVHKISGFNDKVYDRFPISMYVNNHNMEKEYV
ncbi:hypothetical protein CA267_001155 [Alteromonas pelagimontana]|uniref:Uncharacterized protein n=1 Tax=Alteromonas pelagimontana TaxID=1858656 RepID=A0A6M4M9M5_9ALTE|nr:hypothetical protein [Alteromonas pelagimontana]QJR79498.1 hypothetical protein CA267_001155 [Alteromonas pelagimontana]